MESTNKIKITKNLYDRLGFLQDRYLPQLILKFLESGFQVNHLPGLGSLGWLPAVHHRDAVLLDLLLEEAQLTLHLITPAYLEESEIASLVS